MYDNLQIYSFQLDEDDMIAIKELETGIRKIIPVAKLKNGDVVVRDKESKLFPFDFEETYPNWSIWHEIKTNTVIFEGHKIDIFLLFWLHKIKLSFYYELNLS